MNGDTIVVNGRSEEERRVKRVKRNKEGPKYRFRQYKVPENNKILINQENLGPSAALRTSESIQNAQYGIVDTPSLPPSTRTSPPHSSIPPARRPLATSSSSTATSAGGTARPEKPLKFKPYAPRAKSQPQPSAQANGDSANMESSNLAHPKSNSTSMVSPPPPSQPRRVVTRRSTDEDLGEISFTVAPIYAVELAWWLAHHISHLGAFHTHPSRPPSPSTYRDGQPSSFAGERPNNEYFKEQARKRQQRWRASNRERKNLNDLRSRINREAKLSFGVADSKEKVAWIEKEFSKRRDKLESKHMALVTVPGQYPLFRMTEDGRSAISEKDPALPLRAQQMRNLVVDLLFPSSGKRYKNQLESTAESLMELGQYDTPTRDQELKAVLQSIANVPEALKGIKSGLHLENIGLDDAQTPDGVESGAHDSDTATEQGPIRSTRKATRAVAVRKYSLIDGIAAKSRKLMVAVERAVAMLAEINDITFLDTTKSQPGQNRKRAAAKGLKPAGAGIDLASLDAFLVTANAGPLGSQVQGGEKLRDEAIEDDDEAGPDMNGKGIPSAERGQADSQLWREIDQVIDQLVDRRVQYEKKHKNNIKTGFDAKEQADRAREVLMATNLRTNSAMTKGESEAMSHLYTQLFKLVNSDFNPKTASSQNKKRPRAHAAKAPEASHKTIAERPKPTIHREIPDIPSLPPRYNFSKLSLSQHLEGRTEEERCKIIRYGFPPLPGSRVGTQRL